MSDDSAKMEAPRELIGRPFTLPCGQTIGNRLMKSAMSEALGTADNHMTPGLVTLDPDGGEHHRTVGFLAPAELIGSLLLGLGKRWYDRDRFAEAVKLFDRLLAEYPEGEGSAEAIFLRGVCLYKQTHDPKPLKQAYEQLAASHPQSEWTKRAFPYRLL